MRLSMEQTLQIQTLTSTGLKQLIMDLRKFYHFLRIKFDYFFSLEYLYSVLEDFGLKNLTDFGDMIGLLNIDENKFEEFARDKPARMVTTIRTMRHL